jgi:hypothetical protein
MNRASTLCPLYYYAYDFSQLAQIFLAEKTPDSAPLSPGYQLTGAQSAPYEYLRDLRALRGEGLFSFGCGFAALGSLWLNLLVRPPICTSFAPAFRARIRSDRPKC